MLKSPISPREINLILMELYFCYAYTNNKALKHCHFLLFAKIFLPPYRREWESGHRKPTYCGQPQHMGKPLLEHSLFVHKYVSIWAPNWLVVDPVVSLWHSSGYLGKARASWFSGNWLSHNSKYEALLDGQPPPPPCHWDPIKCVYLCLVFKC